ncbi:MAG TPA: tetratricopeptide repeat protein [Candidatus Marinimicrobia bacterium]|nr:tetratricopeptide repeat protein [Candidatus Neomarinimicrobiota bacterium]
MKSAALWRRSDSCVGVKDRPGHVSTQMRTVNISYQCRYISKTVFPVQLLMIASLLDVGSSQSIEDATEVRFEDFLGSEVCKECHVEQYSLWRNSTHGQAGNEPEEAFIIGRFDGEPRHFADGFVTPTRREDGRFQFIVERSGFPRQVVKVDGVVGKGHMIGGGTQSYFSLFQDGTMRLLPFDYHKSAETWFCETNNRQGWVPISEKLSMSELSEWPPNRVLGAEPTLINCQQCHGSQILTEFNEAERRFKTMYKSLSINCESCHGPGRRHVELVRAGETEQSGDIGMTPLSTLGMDESLDVCFQCHALKDVIKPGYLPGMDLEEYYSLKLPIFGENPYHPDGRVRAFAYQQNHLFSDCTISGSMTCVDCHNPHSQGYRNIRGEMLKGKFDDRQCTGCHSGKEGNLEAHTFHSSDSPGSRCTACHMPFFQHKATGDILPFSRSDHTISIPRPLFDESLGLDNACSQCHRELTERQLQDRMFEWYGELKPHRPLVSGLLSVKETDRRERAAELILGQSDDPPVVAFTGLSYFILHYLKADMKMVEPEVVARLKVLCDSDDLDVRALALAALDLSLGTQAPVRKFLSVAAASLGPDKQKVRDRWALVLAYLAQAARTRGDLANAATIYQKSLNVKPNDPATLVHLGLTYAEMGNSQRAISYYQKSLDADPLNWIAWVNLGNAYRSADNPEFSEGAYARSIEINPYYAPGQFNMGNVFYGKSDYAQARHHYERAVELDPSIALAHFYLARAYLKLRLGEEALASVERAVILDPDHQNSRMMRQDLRLILGK